MKTNIFHLHLCTSYIQRVGPQAINDGMIEIVGFNICKLAHIYTLMCISFYMVDGKCLFSLYG